jgi:prophage regulatory protein
MSVQLLRLPAVLARTGLTRTALYELVKAGRFPKQHKLGERAVAWRSDDVDAWIASTAPVGASLGASSDTRAA